MIQHQAALGRDVGNSVSLMLLSLGWSTFNGMPINFWNNRNTKAKYCHIDI